MKQLFAIFLTLIMVCTLCACGRKPSETTPATVPTTTTTATVPTTRATAPTTQPSMPIVDPTMETNIPDPSVDTSMPNATDLLPTDDADSTDNAGETTQPITNGARNRK